MAVDNTGIPSDSNPAANTDSDLVRLAKHYDDTPYISLPFPMSSPDHLEAIAWLCGAKAPAPSHARVLELGCASGGNIIPHALRYPESSYTGVDLSEVQIAAGQNQIRQLGLKNVQLIHKNLADIDTSLGLFDYIICHGIYNWVSAEIQNHVLRVCSENLAENGVVFISYNIYPGWKFKELLRDAMMFRTRLQTTDHSVSVDPLSDARRIFDLLHQASRKGSLINQTLSEHADAIHAMRDDYLAHEYLEPHNLPCFFHEFIDRTREHSLTYLGDSAISIMHPHSLDDDIAVKLAEEAGGDPIALEQYLDFIHNRPFRRSLLTKSTRTSLSDKGGETKGTDRIHHPYTLDSRCLQSLCFGGEYTLAPGETLSQDDSAQTFFIEGIGIGVTTAIGKAAMQVLGSHYPVMLSPDKLTCMAQALLGKEKPSDAGNLLRLLESLVTQGAIIARKYSAVTHPFDYQQDFRSFPTAKPVATPAALALARHKLQHPDQPTYEITTVWHSSVSLDNNDLQLLAHMDGTCDMSALAELSASEEPVHAITGRLHQQGLLSHVIHS